MKRLAELLLLTLVVLGVGCASQRTLGDRMIDVGEQTSALGDKWNQGQKLVEKGEKLRLRGAKQVEDGQANLAKAESQIREGQELMAANEESFKAKLARND